MWLGIAGRSPSRRYVSCGVSRSQIQIGRKSSPYNSEDEEVSHIPIWRRAQNAVCLNSVGHDGDDSSNAASSEASTHNFLILMLASGGLLAWWRRRQDKRA